MRAQRSTLVHLMLLAAAACSIRSPSTQIRRDIQIADVRDVHMVVSNEAFWADITSTNGRGLVEVASRYSSGTAVVRVLASDNAKTLDLLTIDPSGSPWVVGRLAEARVSAKGVYAHWKLPGQESAHEHRTGENPREVRLRSGRSCYLQGMNLRNGSRTVFVESDEPWDLETAYQVYGELRHRMSAPGLSMAAQVWPHTDFRGVYGPRFDPFRPEMAISADAFLQSTVVYCSDLKGVDCRVEPYVETLRQGRVLIPSRMKEREQAGERFILNTPSGGRWDRAE